MNYIKIFQNAQALSVSVGKNYSEDQFMHIFLDNFHQGVKYTAQKENHRAELRREGKFTDQTYLSISSLRANYLILIAVQCMVKIMREQILFRTMHSLWRC